MNGKRKRNTTLIALVSCLAVLAFSEGCKSISPDTRLIIAAERGKTGAATEALHDGANPNAIQQAIYVVNEPVSPLMAACYSPKPAPNMVSFLIDHGADVNLQNEAGRTALMVCSSRGLSDMVSDLLDNGADPLIKDRAGRTAAYRAAEMAQYQVAQRLSGGIAASELVTGTLLGAVFEGSLSRTEQVTKQGADVNATNHFGSTPLAIAAFQCNEKIAQQLVMSGAKLEWAGTGYVTTPLHIAAEQKCLTIMRLLLAKGANPDATEEIHQETPLFAAARSGSPEAVRLLLENGANANRRSNEGETPLSAAVGKDVVAVLKAAGGKK